MQRKDQPQDLSAGSGPRRQFLKICPAAVGTLWLADRDSAAVDTAGSAGLAHLELAGKNDGSRKAKRVIFLHMVGGPSQLELFDYKPDLQRRDGERCPAALMPGNEIPGRRTAAKLLGPQCAFAQHGQSGAWVSDHLPHFSRFVDSVAFIKSMQTDHRDHASARQSFHTSAAIAGSPSIGSCLTYGLGAANPNLPAHIVLTSGGKRPSADAALWGSGCLPRDYQGVRCRHRADPVLCLTDPEGWKRPHASEMVKSISAIKRQAYERIGDPDMVECLAQHQIAFQMQRASAEALDVDAETAEVHRLYGTAPGEASFANNCLRARRLIERGVRCVQLFDQGWDSHGFANSEALNRGFRDKCRQIDQPIAALLQDLQRSGLLEETLVVWGGEFGRGPAREFVSGSGTEPRLTGRGHQPQAFTAWLAGGGVSAGVTVGATDSLGASVVEQPVHVRDLHATLFQLLGLEHGAAGAAVHGRDADLSGTRPAIPVRAVVG